MVKALLKINYDYIKSFNPDSRDEVPARSRQAGIPYITYIHTLHLLMFIQGHSIHVIEFKEVPVVKKELGPVHMNPGQ